MLRQPAKRQSRLSASPAAISDTPRTEEVTQSGSLSKGLAILNALATIDGALGVTELAATMGMTKSGVHRLLQVLRSSGWITQTADGRYQCSMRLWELGMRMGDRFDLRRVSRAAMHTLADATQESIHLSILDDAEVLYVDKIDSLQPVRAYSTIGGRAPAHAVATGKVLLAHCDAQTLARVTRSMRAFTQFTITSKASLEEELQHIRKVGFAINRGEWRESVCGVAAAIFDRRGELAGAIGISGPAERLTLQSMRKLAPQVVAAARAISDDLGNREDNGKK